VYAQADPGQHQRPGPTRTPPKLEWSGGGMQNTCNISETVQSYYDGLIESRTRAFDSYQKQWCWTTLNGWYALLQERCVLWVVTFI